MRRFVLNIMAMLSWITQAGAQTGVTYNDNDVFQDSVYNPYKFNLSQLIIPSTLIGVGIIGLESDWLEYQNREVRDELQENIDNKITIDDFTQYAPMAATYGLNLCGIKGKHGYGDLTIILGTAYALMGVTVNTMKNVTKIDAPMVVPGTHFRQGIQPLLSWERNYCVGNIGTCRRGLVWQDTPLLQEQASFVCITTAIG